jgi:hypothetical protein
VLERRLVVVTAAAALLLVVAPTASGSLNVKRNISRDISFAGTGCGAQDTVQVSIPAKARGPVTIVRPQVGAVLSDDLFGDPVAEITAASVLGRQVMWTATATPSTAPCTDPGFWEGFEWSATPRATLTVNVPVRLSSRAAERLTARALKRRFGTAYSHGYGHRIQCRRRLSPTRISCRKISWIIGDGVYFGRSTIWLTKDRFERVHWNYAYRIKRFDEYCALVLEKPRSKCIKTYVVR